MIRNPYDRYLEKCCPDDEVYCSLSYSDAYQRTGPPREYIPSSLLSSITTGGTSPRQYIDPWDLENYAYLQRRGSETETAGAYTSEDCESTASSQFYYRRGEYYDHLKYNTNLSGEQSFVDYGPCDGSCSCRSEYAYGGLYSPTTDYSTRRPKQDPPQPQLQFPPPPYEYDYDPYDLDSSDAPTAATLMECQECSLSVDNKIYASRSEDIYYTPPTPPRHHFSLSKKGLLQIDYSCNWNCLDFNFRRM